MRRISQILSGQKTLLSRHRPSVFEPLAKELTLTTLAAHVDDVEDASIAADAALDARLDAEEALSVTFDSRLDAEEALSVTFDSRLDAVEADIVAIEATLADTDTRLDLIEADVADLEDRVTDLEVDVADHETRIAALEAGGTPPPSFPTIAATIEEYWKFYEPYITHTDGRVTAVTGTINGIVWTAAGTARPWYKPKAFNGGYECCVFNGTSHIMSYVAAATRTNPFTIIAVIEDYTGGSGNQNLVNTGSIAFFISAGNWAAFAGTVATHSSSGGLTATAPLLNGATKHPVCAIEVFNGASTVINCHGTEQTVNSGANVNAIASGATIRIGDDGLGTSRGRFKIRELIFVRGIVTAPERAALITYYSHPAIAGIQSPI